MSAGYKLLTRGNPKIAKGEARGFLTFVLHLAPADLSGFNVCPMATQGCKAACLNTAGRGGIPSARPVVVDGEAFANPIQAARVRRTRRYFADRAGFMADLVADVRRGIAEAERLGFTPVFRLNGTSDIRWERVPVEGAPNIMALFPDVQFYDYTKIANRRDLPSNYHLTFSLAENNDAQAAQALANGISVAAVFATRKGATLPSVFMGRPVVDGDETDLRFLDPRGVIVGLRAKGKAKADKSGFVRPV
jgi:hypothetical protein